MKKIILVFTILISSYSFKAQELTWETDMNKAIEVSKKEQKPIMMFFTGSDWCGWCIKLQKEVFKTPEFTTWAQKNVVLLELDFPRRTPQDEAIKQQNAQLQQVFQVRGYPTVWIVKAGEIDGKTNFEQLGQTGYVAGGPTKWLEGANQMVAKFTPYEKSKKSKK